MKKITIKDVQNVPETEFIDMVNYADGTCPFCGAKLKTQTVGIGRDKCQQYIFCGCEVAEEAEKHNRRRDELKHHEWLREREAAAAAERKRRDLEARKPITVSALDIICAYTGLVLPKTLPEQCFTNVDIVMKRAGFGGCSTKLQLESYAKANDWLEGLKDVAEIVINYVSKPEVGYDDDISENLERLCVRHGMPTSITL